MSAQEKPSPGLLFPNDSPEYLTAVIEQRNAMLTAVQAENARLRAIAVHLHWMARRYADGRQSYATSLHNENTRALLEMGVPLNATGDRTLWARDSAGRAYDGLTEEEAVQGRKPDWKHDDKERRIEQQVSLMKPMAEALKRIALGQVSCAAEAQQVAQEAYAAYMDDCGRKGEPT